jgi:hypothetical protein
MWTIILLILILLVLGEISRGLYTSNLIAMSTRPDLFPPIPPKPKKLWYQKTGYWILGWVVVAVVMKQLGIL